MHNAPLAYLDYKRRDPMVRNLPLEPTAPTVSAALGDRKSPSRGPPRRYRDERARNRPRSRDLPVRSAGI